VEIGPQKTLYAGHKMSWEDHVQNLYMLISLAATS